MQTPKDILSHVIQIDRFIQEEVDMVPKAAEALALIHHYGSADRESLLLAGVLMKGQGLRRCIDPLLQDGWIVEAKIRRQGSKVRQRSVWKINPDRAEEVSRIMSRAGERLEFHQQQTHDHLASLSQLETFEPKDSYPAKKARMSIVLDRNEGMPSTVAVQFSLQRRYEEGRSKGYRIPTLIVTSRNRGRIIGAIKRRQAWRWTDHELIEAQAQAIALAGSAWPEDAVNWPLETLLEEFDRRKVSFKPLTMHQILGVVSGALDSQAPGFPSNVRLTTDLKRQEVRIEPRGVRRSKDSKALPWEPLSLRAQDFESDITMDDLICLGHWFALHQQRDQTIKNWDLDPSRF